MESIVGAAKEGLSRTPHNQHLKRHAARVARKAARKAKRHPSTPPGPMPAHDRLPPSPGVVPGSSGTTKPPEPMPVYKKPPFAK